MAKADDVVVWLKAYDNIFSALRQDVALNAEACGAAGRVAEYRGTERQLNRALGEVVTTAERLLARCEQAKTFPMIPDPETQRLFRLGLDGWTESATALRDAALGRDVPEILRAGDALDVGNDDFLRMAAQLRRATGQPPDPNNPMG